MENKIPLLTANDIEVKVKQISEKGAVVLLYKTARVDMAILDKVFGVEGWQTDYKEIKGNLYCGIAIKDNKGEWVWKWDCGIESREDNEGNQKKGEASDAFKRAGFKVGIGRELYTSPFTFVQVETKKDTNGRWQLVNPYTSFEVSKIEYKEIDGNNVISQLEIIDNKKTVVYRLGKTMEQSKQPTQTQTQPTGATTPKVTTNSFGANETSLGCDLCKMPISQKIADYSQEKFGKALCMACQKKQVKK